MNKIKVLIVEDEVIVAEEIAQVLSNDGYEVVGKARNAQRALQLAREKEPDIALLDINIEGNRNGIEVARQMSELHDLAFIFLTAYDDSKLIDEAAKVGARGYLLKPFDSRNLLLTVRMVFESNMRQGQSKKEDLGEMLKDRVFIKVGDRFQKVMVEDISYVEAVGSYCNIRINNEFSTLSFNLKKFTDKITSPLFVRVHRSFVVNIAKVDSINGSTIYIDKYEIPLSQSYREALLKKLSLL